MLIKSKNLKKGASQVQPFNSPRLKLWIIAQVTRACDCQVAIHCGGGPKRQCVKATSPHLTQSECPRFVLRRRRRGEVSGREERRGSRRINGHNSSRMNTKYKDSLRGPHGRGDGIPQNATPETPPTALSLQSLLLFKRTPRPLVTFPQSFAVAVG